MWRRVAVEEENAAAAGVGRRRPSTKISVRSGAEDGEEGVDGAPDSKVKSWRRLAEAERRRMSVLPAAQALCSDSGNTGGAATSAQRCGTAGLHGCGG